MGLDDVGDAQVQLLVVGLHNEVQGDGAQAPKEVGLHIGDQGDVHMAEQMGEERHNLVLGEVEVGHHSQQGELHRVGEVHKHHVVSDMQNEVRKEGVGLVSRHKAFGEGHGPLPQH